MLFRRPFGFIAILACFCATCFAADGKSSNKIFTITVASPTSAKDVQVRYFLGGEFGVINSTSTAIGKEDKIVIMTEEGTKQANSFKAIAFAPGCQFVTFTVDDLSNSNRQGDFECQKLPTTPLQGKIDVSRLQGKELQVEVLYVCNWASQFFKLGSGAVSPFSLTKTQVATDGTFSIELPDFAGDPLWSSFSNNSFLSFHLIDAGTGQSLNGLVPPSAMSQGSLLRVAPSYPGETLFAIQETEAVK